MVECRPSIHGTLGGHRIPEHPPGCPIDDDQGITVAGDPFGIIRVCDHVIGRQLVPKVLGAFLRRTMLAIRPLPLRVSLLAGRAVGVLRRVIEEMLGGLGFAREVTAPMLLRRGPLLAERRRLLSVIDDAVSRPEALPSGITLFTP